MRCKNCDYALWNLPARQCPECGTAFVPSEFRFVPSSVRFECPHCAQAYYGTDESGHLVPRGFDCGKCGNHIHMDEMILRPTEGVKEEKTAQVLFPWVHPGQRSITSAWMASVGMAMTKPGQMMRTLPERSVLGKAWSFVILNTVVVVVATVAPILLFVFVAFVVGIAGGGGGGGAAARGGTGMLVGMSFGVGLMVLAAIVVTLIYVPLWALLAHGILRLTGPTAGTMGRTTESICFASGANLLSAVPCIGGYVGWIWWVVSAVIATKERQKVSGGRASLAVLSPIVMAILAVIGLYALLIAWSINAGAAGGRPGGFGGWSITMNQSAWKEQPSLDEQARLLRLHARIVSYAQRRGGELAAHPIEYVSKIGIGSSELVSDGSKTSVLQWRSSGVLLIDMQFAEGSERDLLLAQATQGVDKGTPGLVRLGDYLFMAAGVDLNSADPSLWLVVCYPDPTANPSPAAADLVHVLRADGTVETFAWQTIGGEIEAQNVIRSRTRVASPGVAANIGEGGVLPGILASPPFGIGADQPAKGSSDAVAPKEDGSP